MVTIVLSFPMTLAPLPNPPGTNALFPPLLTRSFVPPRTFSHFGPLCFQSFAHSSAIGGGGGCGPQIKNAFPPANTSDPRPTASASFPQPLCFHTLTNSFATRNFPTPLFSSDSKLLCKNTRGWVSPFLWMTEPTVPQPLVTSVLPFLITSLPPFPALGYN